MRRLGALLLLLILLPAAGCAGPVDFVASKAAVDPPPEDYAEASDGFRYTRSALTGQEQYLYDQLARGISQQAETIEDLYPDTEMIQTVIQAIDRDYPEFFWFSGNGQIETTLMGDRPIKATYRPTYTMNQAERSATQAQINAWESACLYGLPQNGGDYEKALHVYQYIIDHADYQVVEGNSITHIMVDGAGLCGCYTKTAQYILNRLGIHCAYITGQAGGEAHAWNLIWLDGTPCWMDVTWGDPVFDGGENSDGPAYEYFGITTADLLRNHIIDDVVPVPQCTSEAYNYFIREGLYFETYSPAAITEAIKDALVKGEHRVSLRFSDEAYPTAIDQLFTKAGIHALLQTAAAQVPGTAKPGDSLLYNKNDAFCTVAVRLP